MYIIGFGTLFNVEASNRRSKCIFSYGNCIGSVYHRHTGYRRIEKVLNIKQ